MPFSGTSGVQCPYAESFCEALAEYMRGVLPITHPTESKMAAAQKTARCSKISRAVKNPDWIRQEAAGFASGRTGHEHMP